MTRTLLLILCLGLVSACDSGGGDVLQTPDDEQTGNGSNGDGDGDQDGAGGGPIDSDKELPPGTETPNPSETIFRREPFDAERGDGYLREVRYNADDDTFFVEGLGFDGSQPDGAAFSRSAFGQLGSRYALYEAPRIFNDSVTGTPINQLAHRALYGVSPSGQTEFAIVRTGGYMNYGFGGFIYQRNGDVVLPAEGQGTYKGDYGAVRDFDGRGGLEYTDGIAEIDIDFSGFRGNCVSAECDNAVKGTISGRRLFDVNGNDITRVYLDALSAQNGGVALSQMPVVSFEVGPNVADRNGEISGTVFTALNSNDGTSITSNLAEGGSYYAVMSGDHTSLPGGEIVGVVVFENDDPRYEGVTVRETGGFVAVRR
ncbi:hypothetical protein [Marivita sp. S2033]|uniref:hypothetical protein n=1 Tax=Marivita sp. S2033 TaxID=3373187 RepID=UPI003982ADD4